MKVIIDEAKCQGHGRCYSLEPSLFEPKDDFGHSQLIPGAVLDDDGTRARAVRAVDACPERAITIEDQ